MMNTGTDHWRTVAVTPLAQPATVTLTDCDGQQEDYVAPVLLLQERYGVTHPGGRRGYYVPAEEPYETRVVYGVVNPGRAEVEGIDFDADPITQLGEFTRITLPGCAR